MNYETHDRKQKIEFLREAINAGQESGYIENFDPKAYLAELHKEHVQVD